MESPASPMMVQPSNPPKDPVIAAVLSFLLLGGAGHIYLGQTKKGVILIVATIVLACVGVGFLIPFLGAYDAYALGNKLKLGQPVAEMEFFWSK